jgi:serine/threonine protein kinase
MTPETTPFSSTEPEIGDPFPGEFRLLRRLGRGTFGEVWLAEDLSPLGRLVALKFLNPGKGGARAQQALDALRNDARLLASLRHPNIVAVHAWRQSPSGGTPCLVMQYVSGGSLEQRVRSGGPLPWALGARYIADVADGLLLVHGKDIVHRDVKPANILHDPETDEALLTDFGIAARLVDARNIAGSPPYMAPEAFRVVVAPCLDVYGLAASLFWLVTGTTPFAGDDVTALLENIERGLPAVEPRFACVPAPLEELLRAGLAADSACRPSLEEFVRHLRGTLNLLLADCLTLPVDEGTLPAPVKLRLIVSRQGDDGTCVLSALSRVKPEPVLRDMKRVPPVPERIRVRTGEHVQLDIDADQPGFVTVFNLGPTGNLNLLCPNEVGAPPAELSPQRPLRIADVVLTPPAGRERVLAVWTRRPLPLRLDELRSLVEGDTTGGPYRATRDMERVGQSLQSVAPQDRCTVVVELDHV